MSMNILIMSFIHI